MLHGTGGDENDLVPLGQSLAPGAGILSPRGAVLENGMPRFFRRLSEGVFDEEDLILRTHDLADFIKAAAEHYGFDPRMVIGAGYSNGANIAASMLLLRPEALSAAILLRPMVPLVPDALLDLLGRPVFIGSGRNDPLVSVNETHRLVELLRTAGAEVHVHWQEAGHQVTHEEMVAAKAWLSEHCGINLKDNS